MNRTAFSLLIALASALVLLGFASFTQPADKDEGLVERVKRLENMARWQDLSTDDDTFFDCDFEYRLYSLSDSDVYYAVSVNKKSVTFFCSKWSNISESGEALDLGSIRYLHVYYEDKKFCYPFYLPTKSGRQLPTNLVRDSKNPFDLSSGGPFKLQRRPVNFSSTH